MSFSGHLGFPSVILVNNNKSLKALCLSSQMVCENLLYLLSLWTCWHLKFSEDPTQFSMGILEGVEWPISQADYNEPKQQWLVFKENKFKIN